jgi:hypothetical protein
LAAANGLVVAAGSFRRLQLLPQLLLLLLTSS